MLDKLTQISDYVNNPVKSFLGRQMMDTQVEQVEKLFLPSLERFAAEMQRKFSALRINVWRKTSRFNVRCSPDGTMVEDQAYVLGVKGIIVRPNNSNTADNFALSVELINLTSTPRVMAGVMWTCGTRHHPSFLMEAAFRSNWKSRANWPEATPSVLKELADRFPKLSLAFQSAVERGGPPSGGSQSSPEIT